MNDWINTRIGHEFVDGITRIGKALTEVVHAIKEEMSRDTRREYMAFEIYKRSLSQKDLLGPVSTHTNMHRDIMKTLARESIAAADIFYEAVNRE